MHRFFVGPESFWQTGVTLTGPQAHQIANVLRMRPGDRCLVLDNTGWQYDVELVRVTPSQVVGDVGKRRLVDSEPRVKIAVHQAMLRSNRFDLVLQKCTELGVAAFVPMICDRCVAGELGDGSQSKLQRWERIIVEAAEQSGRGKLPSLQPPTMFAQACELARGLSLIPWEGERERHLRDALRGEDVDRAEPKVSRPRPFTVNVFIGPEGGFTREEIETAIGYGIVPVTLGKLIQRAETAAITAAAMTLYEYGEIG